MEGQATAAVILGCNHSWLKPFIFSFCHNLICFYCCPTVSHKTHLHSLFCLESHARIIPPVLELVLMLSGIRSGNTGTTGSTVCSSQPLTGYPLLANNLLPSKGYVFPSVASLEGCFRTRSSQEFCATSLFPPSLQPLTFLTNQIIDCLLLFLLLSPALLSILLQIQLIKNTGLEKILFLKSQCSKEIKTIYIVRHSLKALVAFLS